MEALAGPLDWLLGLLGWGGETCDDCGRFLDEAARNPYRGGVCWGCHLRRIPLPQDGPAPRPRRLAPPPPLLVDPGEMCRPIRM